MNDEHGGEVLRFLREETSIPALLMSVSPLGWGPDLEKRYGAVGFSTRTGTVVSAIFVARSRIC